MCYNFGGIVWGEVSSIISLIRRLHNYNRPSDVRADLLKTIGHPHICPTILRTKFEDYIFTDLAVRRRRKWIDTRLM